MFLRHLLPVLLLVAILISGCASFPGNDLPRYTYEQIPQLEPKPSIDYDLRFMSFGSDNTAAVKILQEEVEKVFNESKIFQTHSAITDKSKYHFSMVLRNEGNAGLAFLSGFMSGMTLTLVPAYARDEYILTVDVKNDGELIKTYKYSNHMDTWLHLAMIFLTSKRYPDKIARDVFDDMIRNFLHDLQKDKLLQA